MREVSDALLLNMAEVSSALVGLFLIGVFFYVETGFRRSPHREVYEPYLLASTRIVLLLFAIPIGVSLTLVALELVWSRVLFALLSLLLVAANVETVARVRSFERVTHSTTFLLTEIIGTLGVAALVVIPWILGGLEPTREHLMWSILLAFVTGFLGICAIVLSAFELARSQIADDKRRVPRRFRRRTGA